MPHHKETRRLPYSPEQMFALVADVQSYQKFLPWVTAIRVRSNSPTEMVADMIVGFKGLRESFTSRVHKEEPTRVHVDYLDGPLKHLSNDWRFRPDGEGGVLGRFRGRFRVQEQAVRNAGWARCSTRRCAR
jgi:coenzyme Q-binding protein COQ10